MSQYGFTKMGNHNQNGLNKLEQFLLHVYKVETEQQTGSSSGRNKQMLPKSQGYNSGIPVVTNASGKGQ